MTQTDELRRMLDERGVEWWPMHDVENGYYQDRDTEFVIDGKKYTAHEWGRTLNVYGLTPEQIIAVTVGSDKVEAVLRKLIARLGVAADFHFATKYVDCIVEEYASNLATLDAGTCHITPKFTCSECGHQYPTRNYESYETCDGRTAFAPLGYNVLACKKPNYCPNCGRKVVDA